MIRPPRKGIAPSLVDVINRLIEQRLCDVHTSIPGRVVSFNAANHTADIQPLLKNPTFDEWQNRGKGESYPVLPDVAVRYPCGGAYTITWPLAVGDMGMIEICEGSLEEVELSGDESDPYDTSRHDLAHATFVPNFWDRTDLTAVVASALVIGCRETGQQVRIGASTVEACSATVGAATDFVAMAAKVLTELGKIQTALGAHTHGGVTTGSGTTGVGIHTYTPASVSSTNLKAD